MLLFRGVVCPLVAIFALAPASVQFKPDDEKGELRILVDGREALVYCHGADLDLAHYYPVRSPSGRSMTVQHPQPYPHHRSFWFADTVQLAGQRKVSFYSALYSRGKNADPKAPFRDRVRHVKVLSSETKERQGVLKTELLWEMDFNKPILDELREVRVVALGNGEYFLDLQFTLTATYGNVDFVSDATHYAWPYIRMNTDFSVEKGGTITNSQGGVNQKGTHGKEALWVDYSKAFDGGAEGLAIFPHTQEGRASQWLTRDYGCFGPRRASALSGKKFTLEKGQSIKQRVGVLVHRGGVKDGKVAQRYQQYIEGKL